MRHLIGFVLALALVASPLSGSAQEGGEGTTSEPDVQEPAPSTEPVPEEPALQLKLDDAGVEVAPSPPQTFGGYTLEELELRKRRAAFGLIAPAALIVAGVPLLVLGTTGDCAQGAFATAARCDALRVSGIALTVPGTVGMVAASIFVGVRKGELNLALRDYTLDEVELRVKRARIGPIIGGSALVVGAAFVAVALAHQDCGITFSSTPQWCGALGTTGLALIIGGAAGAIATGVLLRVRKKQMRTLQQAHSRRPRRVYWDIASWALVF